MANDESSSKLIDDPSPKILVEVAYALPQKQIIIAVEINKTTTVEEAIRESGILTEFPEIDLTTSRVGIFSKKTSLGQSLQEKDRIEIYRPLLADPKEVRRRRAAEGKAMRKGGGDAPS